jgi:folate-dependent phosphoribosylglycinamide formyltransferase PurN
MIFIGSGSLLRHALMVARENSTKIDLVCLGSDNGLIQFCRRSNFPLLITNKINDELLPELGKSSDGVVLSVNNSSIIRDELLSTDLNFFNLHNGLVQKYRGIAEVCALAAVCNSDYEYGSTLHRLLPGQEVDAGPVLDQMSFKIEAEENFETVFSNSINNYKKQIEKMLPQLVSSVKIRGKYLHGSEIYSYKDVPALVIAAPADRQGLACDLGKYSGLLSKLSLQIKNL